MINLQQSLQLLEMKKDDIIKSLAQKNDKLERQLEGWILKYQQLELAYLQLLNERKKEKKSEQFDAFTFISEDTIIKQQPSSLNTIQTPDKEKQIPKQVNQASKEQASVPKHQNRRQDIFDFFTSDSYKTPVLPKNACQLIEGCFVIEKNASIDHYDPVKLIFPSQKFEKIRSMFDIIYRFIFIDEKIEMILDDQFDSRKNQINFGTPCQDFQFVFDNIHEKEGEKGRINQFQILTNILRKRYIYGIVRPQLITIEKQSYETQLAYGFISSTPFPNFFKDLNRIVQQQIKYRMLNMKKAFINKTEKIDIIAQILKDFTSKSIQNSLNITSYPINLQLKANVCGLRLVYNNKSSYVSDQLNYFETFIHKFSLIKLIKIYHYVLTQQHILIVCKSRKSLNQLFEIIRGIIYPFNWVFPIVYYYSPFFEPFFSSPLPIIIGYIEEESATDKTKKLNLPEHDFITIFAQQKNKQDINEIENFKQTITDCEKKFGKSEKQLSSLLASNLEERLVYKFYQYTKKLRKFIQTGRITHQVQDFHIQLMQTQLVSYYKQTLQKRQAHS